MTPELYDFDKYEESAVLVFPDGLLFCQSVDAD